MDQQQAEHSQATVQRRVAALKSFFDFLAEDSGDLSWPNPVRFKRHGGKLPQRLPRDLSDETVAQVWQVITAPRDQAWFVLMWRAGLRVGEVVDLKLTDLLCPAGVDHPARLRVLGKGRKERMVLLSAEAYVIVQAWLAVRPASDQPYVFLNERGRPLKPNGVLWLLHRYGDQAGVELTPHQLRHTFARQALEAGMPLSSLGKLLGHADLATTQRYTAGADPELNQAYQQAMTRLTVSPAPPSAIPTGCRGSAVRPAACAATRSRRRCQRRPCARSARRHCPIGRPGPPICLTQSARLASTTSSVACPTGRPCANGRKPSSSWLISSVSGTGNWPAAPSAEPADLHRADLQAYQGQRVAQDGVTTTTVNRVISYVLTALKEQAETDVAAGPGYFSAAPSARTPPPAPLPA